MTTPLICWACGESCDASALYCAVCGSEVSPVVSCVRCGEKQSSGNAFCTGCGFDMTNGIVVPKVQEVAPVKLDRCECGGLMKPAHKYGDGLLASVGGGLFGGQRKLFWECRRCKRLKLHESEIEKQRLAQKAAASDEFWGSIGCLLGVIIIAAALFGLFKACTYSPSPPATEHAPSDY